MGNNVSHVYIGTYARTKSEICNIIIYYTKPSTDRIQRLIRGYDTFCTKINIYSKYSDKNFKIFQICRYVFSMYPFKEIHFKFMSNDIRNCSTFIRNIFLLKSLLIQLHAPLLIRHMRRIERISMQENDRSIYNDFKRD